MFLHKPNMENIPEPIQLWLIDVWSNTQLKKQFQNTNIENVYNNYFHLKISHCCLWVYPSLMTIIWLRTTCIPDPLFSIMKIVKTGS